MKAGGTTPIRFFTSHSKIPPPFSREIDKPPTVSTSRSTSLLDSLIARIWRPFPLFVVCYAKCLYKDCRPFRLRIEWQISDQEMRVSIPYEDCRPFRPGKVLRLPIAHPN